MRKHVVIIGGGFGGLNAAKELGQYPELVDVTLIDKKNHHLFQPLLYQVATAGLSPSDIASPIRSVVSHYKNITVYMDEIDSVDAKTSTIHTKTMSSKYDYLIMACGSSHSYFGNDQWQKFAPGLKTLEMSLEIRRRILTAFEKAEKEVDKKRQKELLTFVVVGAGPTGVEMAGAIAEIARQIMEKDFRNIKAEDSKIYLVEGGARVLASFNEDLSLQSQIDLESLGVSLKLNTRVIDINESGVKILYNETEEFIKSVTVIWAAGVAPAAINKTLNVELDRSGRIIVGRKLAVKGHNNLYVIGDQAHFEEEGGRVLPGLAPVAIQMGKCAAQNIIRELKGENILEFKYFDKGQMATIGRRLAVMEFGSIKATGGFAWLSWLFVHIYYLIGFKNRLLVLIQWFWSYITFSRGSRLITKEDWEKS